MPPSSPPRRVSLLPPELDDIDAGWGEEPPTVVPSRAPSLPPRPSIALEAIEDDDSRVTSIPELPQDEFARRLMAENQSHGPQKPVDKATSSSDDELQFVFDQDNPFDRPTRDGAPPQHPSAFPTAPPPPTADAERMRTVPRVPKPQHAIETARSRRGLPGDLQANQRLPSDPPLSPPVTVPPATHREPLSSLAGEREALRPARSPFGGLGPLDDGPLDDGRLDNGDEKERETEPIRERVAAIDRETRPQRAKKQIVVDSEPPLSAMERARRAITPQMRPEPLVRAAAPAPSPHNEMRDRFAMGDFSGALDVAEAILQKSPNDGDAGNVAAKCRDVLYDMYSSRIAGFDREVSVIMGPDQLRWLSLDHRAGFLLAMIDRGTTIDDLLDVSGMPRLDALRILCDLLDQKVIGLGR